MIRGTTPTHIFHTQISLEDIDKLFITYKQGKDTVLEKTLEDVEINTEEQYISVKLSQEDTLKFKDKNWTWLYPNENAKDTKVKIQIRLKYLNGDTAASNIILVDVDDILKDGEI